MLPGSRQRISLAALLVYAGKFSELVGGVLLAFGFVYTVRDPADLHSDDFIAFFIGRGNIWYEDQYPFLFILLGLVFFFMGPGKWSMDNESGRRKVKYHEH